VDAACGTPFVDMSLLDEFGESVIDQAKVGSVTDR